ncbi:Solute carrier family 22 member 5 [Merluccius polli]|uniref:Solute carrier family 22 member 5 n=1 Tax=Merluccius polli TaxID=89951 RepID=A0AA47MGU5_MERPO|nr:Solute carrier family 22 member 5 [Merluccius polli]
MACGVLHNVAHRHGIPLPEQNIPPPPPPPHRMPDPSTSTHPGKPYAPGRIVPGHQRKSSPLLVAIWVNNLMTDGSHSTQVWKEANALHHDGSPDCDHHSSDILPKGLQRRGFSKYLIAYILGTDILSAGAQVVFSSMGVFFRSTLGYMVIPGVAYFVSDWLWLFGRVEEAEAILRQAAQKNKVQTPQVIFTRKRIIITISYYALIPNTSNLNGDPYMNCFLPAVSEVPAYLIALVLLKYCYRHFCQSPMLFLGRVDPLYLPGVSIFLEMMGKFHITLAFCVVYAVTSELFPTVVRNMAMGPAPWQHASPPSFHLSSSTWNCAIHLMKAEEEKKMDAGGNSEFQKESKL